MDSPSLRTFQVCAAMLSSSRGIGIENRLPWPSLRKDYEHYISLSTKPRAQGKKNVVIKGRKTWEGTGLDEASTPDVVNIVISRTLRELPKYVQHIARSLEEALLLASTPPLRDHVDSIWVLGGVDIYAMAFASPLCERIYLTRIHGTFPCDRFLPPFENEGFTKVTDVLLFSLHEKMPLGAGQPNHMYCVKFTFQCERLFVDCRLDDVEAGVLEESGLHFEFEVYERPG